MTDKHLAELRESVLAHLKHAYFNAVTDVEGLNNGLLENRNHALPTLENKADDIMALFAKALAQQDRESQQKLDLVYKKFRKLDAAIFAVMFYLDKPYPDDARWTPYTRFVGPRMKMLQAAFNGEDIGDLEGMARLTKEEKEGS